MILHFNKFGSQALAANNKRSKRMPDGPLHMLEVLGQFRVIIKAIRSHYRDVERAAGISGAQLWTLSQVDSQSGCTVGGLAKALGIHISTASNLVRRLEALALIERRRVGGDQRVVKLHITAKGRAIVRKAPRPLIGVLQQALASLPPERVASLHKDLAALISCMKAADTRARSTPLSEM